MWVTVQMLRFSECLSDGPTQAAQSIAASVSG